MSYHNREGWLTAGRVHHGQTDALSEHDKDVAGFSHGKHKN